MSRSGYSDDCDGWALIRWRGAVNSAIKGARGQAFLREALAILDAMPEKRLTSDTLHEPVDGSYCTLGAIGAARGMDMGPLEGADRENIAEAFGISTAMAAEIMFENDEAPYFFSHAGPPEDRDAKRWRHMRRWVESQILPVRAAASIGKEAGKGEGA